MNILKLNLIIFGIIFITIFIIIIIALLFIVIKQKSTLNKKENTISGMHKAKEKLNEQILNMKVSIKSMQQAKETCKNSKNAQKKLNARISEMTSSIKTCKKDKEKLDAQISKMTSSIETCKKDELDALTKSIETCKKDKEELDTSLKTCNEKFKGGIIVLKNGEYLPVNKPITTNNKKFTLKFQNDCNLVIYESDKNGIQTNKVRWNSSHRCDENVTKKCSLRNGILKITGDSGILWSSEYKGKKTDSKKIIPVHPEKDAFLVLKESGYLELINPKNSCGQRLQGVWYTPGGSGDLVHNCYVPANLCKPPSTCCNNTNPNQDPSCGNNNL